MANSDGKLYIIVTNQLPSGTGQITPEGAEKDGEKKKSDVVGDYAKHQFFNLIKSQAIKAVYYTAGNIGNFTGDYVKQQHVNNSLNVLSGIMDVGMAALAGSKYGPYGAIVAAGITLVAKGVTAGEEIYAGYVENTRTNRAIAQLRERSGLNSTNNNSRGTEN